MSEKIKMIIADDHTLFRKGIISLLDENNKVQVTGEASNGKDLLNLLKTEEPDIILLDLDMPVMDGKKALIEIRKKFLNVKIIIISIHFDYELTIDLMKKGANACLPKECEPEILFEAINSVLMGNYYYSYCKETEIPNSSPYFDKTCLSERELEITKLICEGKANKDIAGILNISVNTVDFHKKNIYKKTNQRNSACLTSFAIKNRLISLSKGQA
ncbi:MAG: response regulator [Bacteroidia bacterium]